MITKNFLLAGRAVFTVEPPAAYVERYECRPHYTYRIDHKPADARWPETWFVKLLTGPDNTSDYSYLGMLSPLTGEVRFTTKSCVGPLTIPGQIAQRVIKAVIEGREEAIDAAGWDVRHEGQCGRCGRSLTCPESIRTGIGPVCAGR